MALGLFGKLPSQGDFITRRLPWEFTNGWDTWLQAGLARARSALGEAWNNTYLTAPLWRFQLAPGVLGAGGWIGLWFASVDRVGRQFPLCVVEPLPAPWAGRYAVIEQDESFLALEDAALRALDPRLSFDSFDHSIEPLSLLAPPPTQRTLVPQSLLLQPVSIDQVGARVLRLAPDADAMTALASAQAAGDARSCFFTWGNDHHAPVLLRSEGLIADAEFRGFLDGRWP